VTAWPDRLESSAFPKSRHKITRLFCRRFLRESFRFLDQQHEACSVFYRYVGKNLAVQFDSGGFQA